MKLPYHSFSAAIAALRQMEEFQPHESRWSKAIYDLREAFLLEVRADLSGDMLIEKSRRPALLRRQAG